MTTLSLKTKMSLLVSLLIAVLLSILAFIALSYFERQLKETVSRQQFTLVSAMAGEIDDKFRAIQAELVAVAGTITPETVADPEKARDFLASRPETCQIFDNGLFLFSRKGRLIAGMPLEPALKGQDFSRRDYHRKTVATGLPQISTPFFSAQEHRHPIVMFTAPVRDGRGRLTAILAGSLDLMKDNFLGKLAAVRLGVGGYLYLFDSSRTLIVHHDRSRILMQDVPPGVNRLFDRAIAGFEGTGETVTSRGLNAISSFKRLQTTGWILAANFPRSEAYAPVYQARRYLLVALAVVMMISILIVWPFMGYLIAPLQSLTSHVREMAGNGEGLPLSPQVRRRDEIGILAKAYDSMLTAMAEQRQALREQKDFSEHLIRNCAVPAFVIDTNHRVLHWNRACEKLTGLGAADVIGTDRHWQAFYDRQRPCLADLVIDGNHGDAEGHYAIHSRSQLIPDGLQAEGWYPNLNGIHRYIFFDAAPIRNSLGETIAAIETIQDITWRKRIEEKLTRTANDLTESNDEIRSFAYIVSHDLRAPLVNLKGFSGELRQALEELDPCFSASIAALPDRERQRMNELYRKDVPEALGFIDSSVSRMDRLITGILKLSRLGRRELKPERVDMSGLIASILASLAHQLEQRQVTLNIGTLPEVNADRTAMEQIMGNLLDNAVKYLVPGRPGRIGIEAERTAGEVVFHVRDNGRGIAGDDLDRIFEIFRRAGRQDVPGEGLGLAYVKTLVRRQGGRIWCVSKPDEETTFSFAIPGTSLLPEDEQAATDDRQTVNE
jgi:signal transduction histidine kinase